MTTTIPIKAESQRDGSINQDFDCVPDAIDMAVSAVTGQPERGAAWWKNMVYGQGYTGGTAARAYVQLAQKQGARLFSIQGSNEQLVQEIHRQIRQLHPVIVTLPDYLAPNQPTWSHVNLVYEEWPGQLAAIDTWDRSIKTRFDADLARLLEFGEIWVIERIENSMATPAQPVAPKGWKLAGGTLTAPNGNQVILGFAQFVMDTKNSWNPANVPLEHEHGSGQAGGGGTEQLFRDCLLRWTKDTGVSVQTLGSIVLLQRQQLTDASKQLALLEQQIKTAHASIPPAVQAALTTVLHSGADLQAAIQNALNQAQQPVPEPIKAI